MGRLLSTVVRPCVIVAILGATAALGASGTVVDGRGEPIEGASACLVGAGTALLCVETDASGYYELPDSPVNAVRITRNGFLPLEVAVVVQEAPIVLPRAAGLRVRVLEEGTGAPLGGGHVIVTYSDGRQVQPFPFNKGGLSVPSMRPGDALVRVELEGHVLVGGPVPVAFRTGETTELAIRVRRSPASNPAPGDEP